MGRPRKPTKQKQIAGTIRPDRENPNEPEYEDADLRPPAGMSADGRGFWKQYAPELHEKGMLKKVHAPLLVEMCESLSIAAKCRRVINKQGSTYTTRTPTGSNMKRKRPEIEIRKNELMEARQIAVQFGLTLASQGKVNAKPKDQGETQGKARFFRKNA